MVAQTGRAVVLDWGGSQLQGVREKTVTFNGEPIDISSDDSEGWRELLDEVGENSVNIGVSGILKDNVLKTAIFTGARVETASLTYRDGGVISGTFFLASYTETGPYKEGMTFEGELQSSGPVTYTPPP